MLYTIQGKTPPNSCNHGLLRLGRRRARRRRPRPRGRLDHERAVHHQRQHLRLFGPERTRALPVRRRRRRAHSRATRSRTPATSTGDDVTDILTTAPGDGPGHVYVYSGRTGQLIHDLAGENAGDFFGSAVASAGDVDRDHRAGHPRRRRAERRGGPERREGLRVLRANGRADPRAQVGDQGDLFGSAVDWSEDLNGDHVPDHIVGARGGGLVGPGNGPAACTSSPAHGRAALRHPGRATSRPRLLLRRRGRRRQNGTGRRTSTRPTSTPLRRQRPCRRVLRQGRLGAAQLDGAAGEGLGPGREAGDVNRDGGPTSRSAPTRAARRASGGKIEIFSGRDGSLLRSITSLTAGEQLGFDAVGIGDVNRDGRPTCWLPPRTARRSTSSQETVGHPADGGQPPAPALRRREGDTPCKRKPHSTRPRTPRRRPAGPA